MMLVKRDRVGGCDFCRVTHDPVADVYTGRGETRRFSSCAACLRRLGDMVAQMNANGLTLREAP